MTTCPAHGGGPREYSPTIHHVKPGPSIVRAISNVIQVEMNKNIEKVSNLKVLGFLVYLCSKSNRR